MKVLDDGADHLWGVVGRDKNTNRVVFFPVMFGFAPDPEEALRRVERQYINDPTFKTKFKGWIFSPMLADLAFEVTNVGGTMMLKNEKEPA